MRLFLDTAIFMYAGGAEHRLRVPCQRILERVRDGQLEATTSAEVVQEIIHRYLSINRSPDGVRIAREALALFQPVVAATDAIARRLPNLAERYPTLDARDLVHVATCMEEGIGTIISPDTGFDAVSEVRRLHPIDAAT